MKMRNLLITLGLFLPLTPLLLLGALVWLAIKAFSPAPPNRLSHPS